MLDEIIAIKCLINMTKKLSWVGITNFSLFSNYYQTVGYYYIW